MHVALHDVLINQDLQGLVARVLVHVECVAVLGDCAVGAPGAIHRDQGIAPTSGLRRICSTLEELGEVDDIGAVAYDLDHAGAVGFGQLQEVVEAELDLLCCAIGQVGDRDQGGAPTYACFLVLLFFSGFTAAASTDIGVGAGTLVKPTFEKLTNAVGATLSGFGPMFPEPIMNSTNNS